MSDVLQDDYFWDAVAPFDTGLDSPLRDANPSLFHLLRCSEAVLSIPLQEALRIPPLGREAWLYVRRVAVEVMRLFNPDGTVKEQGAGDPATIG